jgi:hypothetical protein
VAGVSALAGDSVEYAFGYAGILTDHNQFSKAEAVLDGLLAKLRDLAAQNPAAYQADLDATLTNLAKLPSKTR